MNRSFSFTKRDFSLLRVFLAGVLFLYINTLQAAETQSWIRINQLGYTPASVKVAVLATKHTTKLKNFQLIDASTQRIVFKGKIKTNFGSYGPFQSSYRLDFSGFQTPGIYYLQSGTAKSPQFQIDADVYRGTADFALRYMRQQRCGFNPFLKDSCHTHDGYTLYGPMPEKTHVDVVGGWHDATDYLQYSTTSANATYHLLAAYRDFKNIFTDKHLANGLEGTNNRPDILDEAKWGIDWLLKMHPQDDWLFNQIADDRDHAGYRLPNHDLVDYGYGKGTGRPVYFITGDIQGFKIHKNRATGTSSTAGKFASAFALGSQVFSGWDAQFSEQLKSKSISAYKYAFIKPGVSQTAPGTAPYFYEEDNWVDDMELGAAAVYKVTNDPQYQIQALKYSEMEKVTPWMGADTARHYQWYPFHNFGHLELAERSDSASKAKLISYYKEGIEKVWTKSKNNAFYRGIPFIWCSNNLTTSFAIQCILYRRLSGDDTYIRLEQAAFDWLFGLNPWGTSMVYGLPDHGDTPIDPHSSFTVLNKFPLDGGLVDGPVNGNIFRNLLGINMHDADEYADFQSDLAVYHDDSGDFSTNEPTMDGTASLIYLLAAKESQSLEVTEPKK